MKYEELKITEFLDKLGSTESMPGGGTVAGITGAQAASLISMVCNLTVGKKSFEMFQDDVKKAINEAENFRKKFLELSNKDAENFKEIEKVFKMSKITEEEKKAKKEAMEKACKFCCEVPREMINESLKAMELISTLYAITTKTADSDLRIANVLFRVVIDSAWYNIVINLRSIEDQNFVMEYKEFQRNALKKIDSLQTV